MISLIAFLKINITFVIYCKAKRFSLTAFEIIKRFENDSCVEKKNVRFCNLKNKKYKFSETLDKATWPPKLICSISLQIVSKVYINHTEWSRLSKGYTEACPNSNVSIMQVDLVVSALDLQAEGRGFGPRKISDR